MNQFTQNRALRPETFMARRFRILTISLLALAALLNLASSCQAEVSYQITDREIAGGTCAQDRPCGPDNLPDWFRNFVPQGSHGADFRPSCRSHDACYEIVGVSRCACDVDWREKMFVACDSADRPWACRRKAWIMYIAVRLFGDSAFSAAQGG